MKKQWALPGELSGPSACGRQYILGNMIAQGSQCIVRRGYSWYDYNRINPLAIKLYIDNSPQGLRRAAQEVRMLRLTSGNPYIVDYLDSSLDSRNPYVVMPLVPETLADLLRTDPATGVNRVTQKVIETFLEQFPRIYQYFYGQGIAHCDLKPNNIGYIESSIMEGTNDMIKVLDLGLAIPFRNLLFFSGEAHVFYPPELRMGGIVSSTCDVYCAEKVLEGLLMGSYFSPSRKVLQARNLEEKMEEGTFSVIDYIELFHDVTLPVSFKRLLVGMSAADHAQRPRPWHLQELASEALADIKGKEIFKPLNFENIEELDYFPKSSASVSHKFTAG